MEERADVRRRTWEQHEALVAELYGESEIDPELPEAVARVEAGLSKEDPRRAPVQMLPGLPREA
jgi:hypothetical protein